jgi:hypothetical protein
MAICSSMSPTTTKKYLRVAFMDGVATTFSRGSRAGTCGSASSAWAVWYQTMPAIPASSRITLAMVHMAAEPGSVLPTRGSCGQLLVYERPCSPGRSVAAAQEVQKKKPASALRSTALGSKSRPMAYFSRNASWDAAAPNRAS